MEEEKDSSFALPLSFLFGSQTATVDKLVSYLGIEGLPILKKAYMAGLAVRDHSDSEGKVFNRILDLDQGFLREYLTLLVEKAKGNNRRWLNRTDDSRNFSFLWFREDCESILGDALQYLFELWRSEKFYTQDYLKVLFVTRRGEVINIDLEKHQVKLLGSLIEKRANDADFMEYIFHAVGELSGESRRELIELFLNNNKRMKDFERLTLGTASGSWSGSAVPYFQKSLDFVESLLPLVEGLDYLEHRSDIEKRIEGLQKTIEKEKRRNFIGEV
jgi:hypothetical protein